MQCLFFCVQIDEAKRPFLFVGSGYTTDPLKTASITPVPYKTSSIAGFCYLQHTLFGTNNMHEWKRLISNYSALFCSLRQYLGYDGRGSENYEKANTGVLISKNDVGLIGKEDAYNLS